MTHQEIEEQEWIERYLAGTLPESIQHQLEEHFAACQECLEKLETDGPTVDLIATACREAQAEVGWRARRARGWFLAPAGGIAATVAVAIWITAGEAPLQPVSGPTASGAPPVITLRTFRSGGETAVRSAETARPFALRLDLQGLEARPPYAVEVANAEGAVLWRRAGLSSLPGTALEVTVEGAPLATGQYWVRLSSTAKGPPELLREYALRVGP